jgi:hypothetical protein
LKRGTKEEKCYKGGQMQGEPCEKGKKIKSQKLRMREIEMKVERKGTV